jgi:alanine dehydrogenase
MKKIGILKEIKPFEHRVSLTPDAVKALTAEGNALYVESGAGNSAGFPDKDYESAGAQIVPTSEKVFKMVEVVLKVQPPLPIEYELFTDAHLSFSFLLSHINFERLQALQNTSATFFSADMITKINDVMSEIIGKVAVNQAMKYLERDYGGKGILFSGVNDVRGAVVSIIGNELSALAIAEHALTNGARVNIIGLDYEKLEDFKFHHPSEDLNIFEYNRGLVKNILLETDVLMAAPKIPGDSAEMHISKNDWKILEKGILVIDLSVNQGDRIEPARNTNPDAPVYIHDDLVFFSVTNLPSFVPKTSSEVLSKLTYHYISQLAQMGFEESIATNPEIRDSLVLYHGKIVNPILAKSHGLEHYDILELFELNI